MGILGGLAAPGIGLKRLGQFSPATLFGRTNPPSFLAEAQERMFTVYVLKSLKNGKQYIGSTSKDLKDRLDWHRWGLTAWTKQNGPFELVYFETRNAKEEALRREKYFKTGQGRKTLVHLAKALK